MNDDDDAETMHEVSSTERSLDKLFQFKNEEDYNAKTELSHNQVVDITKGSALAIIFDLPLLETFIKSFKTHMISKDRKGRLEVIKAISAEIEKEKNDNKSMFDKLNDKLKGI